MSLFQTRFSFFISCFLSRIILLFFLATSGVGLMPDEAQYWTWSLFPDIGYYSKPPGIAWQIWTGTFFCGQTELGVRLIALLIPIGSGFLIQKIVSLLTKEEKSGWMAASAFIWSPLGMVGSVLATTDGALVFFWLLSLLSYLIAQRDELSLWKTGLCVGLGALWKWMAYTFWIVVVIDLWNQKQRPRSLCSSILLSLIGLLPTLYWNWTHEWGGFHHVASTLTAHHATESSGNFWAFSGAGIALISPGFFFLALPSLWTPTKRWSIVQWSVATIWGALLCAALNRKIQGNWAVVAQSSYFVLLGLAMHMRPRWQRWPYLCALGISIFIQLVVLATPYCGKPFLRICPFTQGIGREISSSLIHAGYDPQKNFLFSDRYQSTSQLWFYGPEQRKSYFLNIHGLRHNQFMYWPGMTSECLGKKGFFVAIISAKEKRSVPARIAKYKNLLSPYFSLIGAETIAHLRSVSGVTARIMIIIPCEQYNGNTPIDIEKF